MSDTTQRLSLAEKGAYGFGAFGKDTAITTVYLFLMFYLTDVLGLNPAFVGTLFLAARMWDAVNDPAMGMFVNNTRSKYGKFKPWIAAGTVANSIVLLLLFWQPPFLMNADGSVGTMMYVYISVIYILWGMTYTMMDIPFWSMVPVVASTQSDRAQVASILRFGASMPWMLMGTFGLTLIAKLSGGTTVPAEQGTGFFRVTIILVVIFAISTVVLLKVLRTRDANVGEGASEAPQQKTSIVQAFRLIRQNDQLVAFIGIVLFFNFMIQLVQSVAIYYFSYVINNAGMLSVFLGVGGAFEMTGIFLYPIVSKIVNPKRSFTIACILPAIGFLSLLYSGLVSPNNTVFIIGASALFRLGSGLFLAGSIVMLSNIVDYSKEKFGSSNESIIFSVQTLLVKSASAFSGWLVGMSLAMSGYVAGTSQSESTVLVIRMLMTVAPAGLALLALIIDRLYFRLHHVDKDGKLYYKAPKV